jgi:hypothetical protein
MRSAAKLCFLYLAARTSAAEAVPCAPNEVTGLFTGSVKTSSGTATDVALNLFCSDRSYAARIFTSMGDFPVKSVESTTGYVPLALESGASLGTFDLTREDAGLAGGCSLAEGVFAANLLDCFKGIRS